MSDTGSNTDSRSWMRRLGWLLAIWAVSVAALAGVAWLLKGVMRMVGLST